MTDDVDAEDELRRFKVFVKVRDDLEKWMKDMKWRYWGALLVYGVVGTTSGYALIESKVTSTVHESVEKSLAEVRQAAYRAVEAAAVAESKTKEAQEKIDKAKDKAERFTTKAEEYADRVALLDKRAQDVNASFIVVQRALHAETENVRGGSVREINVITDRLSHLEALVAELGKMSEQSRNAVAKYQRNLDKRAETARNEEKEFAENSEYLIWVFYSKGLRGPADAVVKKLREAGFRTTSIDVTSERLFWVRTGLSPGGKMIRYMSGEEKKAYQVRKLLALLPEIGEIEIRKEPPIVVERLKQLPEGHPLRDFISGSKILINLQEEVG